MTQSVRPAGVTRLHSRNNIVDTFDVSLAEIIQIRYDFGKILIDVELFEDRFTYSKIRTRILDAIIQSFNGQSN